MSLTSLSLGDIYVSDFLKPDDKPKYPREPLNMIMDRSIGAMKLDNVVDPSRMYGRYWYESGISNSMRNHLADLVADVETCVDTSPGDIWLDIACNDGTLLSNVSANTFNKVGIDPVEDRILDKARRKTNEQNDKIIQDFFTKEVYFKNVSRKAKVITCIAMFYDIDTPVRFLQDVEEVLDDEGLFVMQMSYTPLMVRQMAFDNICHEHVYYYHLLSIMNLVDKTSMEVVDCKLNDTNGGSFRVYLRKKSATKSKFKSAPYRDVAQFRIDSILVQEQVDNVTSEAYYREFFNLIKKLKKQVVDFIVEEKSKGKTIWGYGASTKGNTLLQYFGLDNMLIDAIAERSPSKYGLKTIGTDIPILPEADMRAAKPDYLLILPWHFVSEFRERESEYLKGGGKLIVPCPKFEIIGK